MTEVQSRLNSARRHTSTPSGQCAKMLLPRFTVSSLDAHFVMRCEQKFEKARLRLSCRRVMHLELPPSLPCSVNRAASPDESMCIYICYENESPGLSEQLGFPIFTFLCVPLFVVKFTVLTSLLVFC